MEAMGASAEELREKGSATSAVVSLLFDDMVSTSDVTRESEAVEREAEKELKERKEARAGSVEVVAAVLTKGDGSSVNVVLVAVELVVRNTVVDTPSDQGRAVSLESDEVAQVSLLTATDLLLDDVQEVFASDESDSVDVQLPVLVVSEPILVQGKTVSEGLRFSIVLGSMVEVETPVLVTAPTIVV